MRAGLIIAATTAVGVLCGSAAADPQETSAAIALALAAAPAGVAAGATVVALSHDGKVTTLRSGSNGWTCIAPAAGAAHDRIEHHPACYDKYGLEWMQAFGAGRDPNPDHVGYSYMLQGGSSWSNLDPAAHGLAKGQQAYIKIPGHFMILNARIADSSGFPSREADPDTKRPFVMFAGTRYALLIVPVQ
jgi:hypothetical protein